MNTLKAAEPHCSVSDGPIHLVQVAKTLKRERRTYNKKLTVFLHLKNEVQQVLSWKFNGFIASCVILRKTVIKVFCTEIISVLRTVDSF